MLRTYRSLKNRYGRYRLYRVHRKEATKLLRPIEQKKGRLPRSIRRQTREYATEVLGWSGYADWLQVYATVAGEFREGWIPGNYYSQVVLPSINRKAGEISSIRSLSRHLFRSPHFPDRAHVMNGRLMSPSFRPIPDDAWERTLFRHSNRVVFKPDGGRESSGVMLLDARSLDRERLRTLPDGTLQEFVVQHELFDQIAPGFVTTLRITTVLHPDGQAHARAAFLRTGIDPNQHAPQAADFCIPLNRATGELEELYIPVSVETGRLGPSAISPTGPRQSATPSPASSSRVSRPPPSARPSRSWRNSTTGSPMSAASAGMSPSAAKARFASSSGMHDCRPLPSPRPPWVPVSPALAGRISGARRPGAARRSRAAAESRPTRLPRAHPDLPEREHHRVRWLIL